MTSDARQLPSARTVIGAVLRWIVFFAGPIALIVIFNGTVLSYLLLLLLFGAGVGALELRVDDFRARRLRDSGA